MIKVIMALPILFISVFSNTFSEIKTGTDTVLFNQNITFSPHMITTNDRDSISHELSGYLVYNCTASIPTVDMFIAEEIIGVCTYICHMLAIGSPRPFYLSKLKFETFDFSDQLRLDDATKFIKIDTITTDPHTRDSSHCYLPHVVFDQQEYKYVDFGIFINSDGKFIVAKFDTIMDISSDRAVMPIYHPYIKGYRIKWFIQNNGSLLFDNITHTLNKPRMQNVIIPDNKQTEYYDINGRKFKMININVPKIIIKRNGNKGINQLHFINY